MTPQQRLVQVIFDKVLARIKTAIQVRNVLVTQVVPGAALDGAAQVAVGVGGQDVFAPYLGSYLAPVVGDAVWVLTVFGSPLILGLVTGPPSF